MGAATDASSSAAAGGGVDSDRRHAAEGSETVCLWCFVIAGRLTNTSKTPSLVVRLGSIWCYVPTEEDEWLSRERFGNLSGLYHIDDVVQQWCPSYWQRALSMDETKDPEACYGPW